MRFTQKTDYALRVMRSLAKLAHGTVVPVHKIATEEGLSSRFLQGVVRELVVRGILRSTPGPTGGIALAKPLATISFREVIDSVEGPVYLMNCIGDDELCSNSPGCYIQGVLFEAQSALYAVLENHHMDELSPQALPVVGPEW